MDLSSFSVGLCCLMRCVVLTSDAEIPFALPPGRFEDPVPLPRGYRYERKEYIRETV